MYYALYKKGGKRIINVAYSEWHLRELALKKENIRFTYQTRNKDWRYISDKYTIVRVKLVPVIINKG